MRVLLFSFLFGLIFQNTFAQTSLEEKMKWYALAKPTSNLFVHFDKNVYSNNETVYFTGYLIKGSRIPVALHKVMAIALIREVDSALIAEDKFAMNSGLSFGSLTLPDSIPTGNYRFLVYTDKLVNKLPEVVFIQNITIKSSIEPTFKANVKLMEQPTVESKSLKVLVSTSTIDGRFLSKPAKINYSYGTFKKSATTDASGQSIITLPVQNNTTDPNLYVKLKYEKDSSFISIGIPQSKNKAIVKFYPEGGNMVNELPSNIGWEVKDQQNRPIPLKAFLYKNQKIVDTIETNSYGVGKFMLKPEAGVEYAVKLIHSNLIDSLYSLPKAVEKGLALTLQNAIVEDTLYINLRSTENSKLTMLVHNFRNCFLNAPFRITNENMRIKLALDEIPKGLTTLTIVDSLNRPLAERIFFAHYSHQEKIAITADKEIYNQREKVNLKLNLKIDENALVSVAAVQQNRLDLKKTTDIECYTYLTNELTALPIINNGRVYKDRNYLEQMLLVKGWRRYTWQGLSKSKPTDTLAQMDSLIISGKIGRPKKELTNPLIVGTMGSQSINLITTTPNGFFNLNVNQLITPPAKKIYAFINGVQKLPYEVTLAIHDQFADLNRNLAKEIRIEQPILPSNLVDNSELVLKNNEKAIRLKEVVITNKTNTSFRYAAPGPNACGDYVCMYNILNCRNHFGQGTQPVKGQSYISNGIRIIYAGCTIPDKNLFTLINGVHVQKEFYKDDYKDPNEPAFFSTIYWNYGTLLNSKKETELSFYTSDITGKFKIVVQGVTDKDVVYAEHFFEVKGK